MDRFLTALITGLATGGAFAIASSGLVLTYTTTGVFNFAHGAIAMLGAFSFWQLHVAWGLPTWLSLVIVLVVVGPLLGAVIERVIMRGLRDASDATQIVVTVAILAAALGLGQWLWPPEDAHPLGHFWEGNRVTIGGVNISWHAVFTFVVAVLVALGLRALLFGTRAGVTMRATVDDRRLATLNGARPDRSALLAWTIGCSLAALSGVLIAPDQTLQHTLLTLLVVNAYAAAMFGRLRSLPLTFLGALIIGLADAFGNAYIPSDNDYFSTFRPAIPIVLLFIVLLALPQSRLRGHAIARSRERFPTWSWPNAIAAAVGLLIATGAVASLLTDTDARSLAPVFGIAIVALSLVPLVGYAGQISLCQMSFAGIGAVVMAHHGGGGNPLTLLLVAVICGAVGALVALPALRLSGLYLALATAAFAVLLERWVFRLPAFDVGPLRIELFGFGTVGVDRLRAPGIDPSNPQLELVVLAGLFALLALLVVGIRRSGFGERLLAMKDSPAACATLGINLRATKLAVFALSAAMAGVGGAVYAGAVGSVSADRFTFFASLPVLLLAVVGGIGSPAGALLGALTLQLIPILAGTISFLEQPSRILPGTIGITLGRNPNGIAADLGERLAPLRRSRAGAVGLASLLVLLYGLEVAGAINGWLFGIGVFLAPFLVARLVDAAPAATGEDLDLEWLGLATPYTPEALAAIDEELALTGPPR